MKNKQNFSTNKSKNEFQIFYNNININAYKSTWNNLNLLINLPIYPSDDINNQLLTPRLTLKQNE